MFNVPDVLFLSCFKRPPCFAYITPRTVRAGYSVDYVGGFFQGDSVFGRWELLLKGSHWFVGNFYVVRRRILVSGLLMPFM